MTFEMSIGFDRKSFGDLLSKIFHSKLIIPPITNDSTYLMTCSRSTLFPYLLVSVSLLPSPPGPGPGPDVGPIFGPGTFVRSNGQSPFRQ